MDVLHEQQIEGSALAAALPSPRVLMILTYYLPHCSGLTIYAQRLAEGLAARGVHVTVLTSRHDPTTPRVELVSGVRVVRSPIIAKVHKGVISPALLIDALRLSRSADVVHLHLPMLEAATLAFIARANRRPTVITYHCDLRLPWSLWSRPILEIMNRNHAIAGALGDRVVTYTRDFAEHSPFVSRLLPKTSIILPPVTIPEPSARALATMRASVGTGSPLIGFAGRFAAEKGVEHLIGTIPYVTTRFPKARYVFAGEYERVLGENYFKRLQPLIQRFRDRLVFLGNLDQEHLAAFYQQIDVLTLPSVNSTESFGLVQVEAMLAGRPVVASDLPGVRQPIRMTGMGEVAPPGDPAQLASALIRVLEAPERYARPTMEIRDMFQVQSTVSAYEQLYGGLVGNVAKSDARCGELEPRSGDKGAS
jgi:glycosyltransferase involved in cell wall biosynthesis